MDSGQQKAIEILLRKTLPDLTAVAHSGSIQSKPDELSDADLLHIATGSSARVAEAPDSEEVPDELH